MLKILTNPAFSLATLLFGFLIGHRLAIGRDRRKELRQAIARFQESFVEPIYSLRHPIAGIVFHLDHAEGEHEKAKTRFWVSISSKHKRRLNKIWGKYKNDTNKYYAKYCGRDEDSSAQWRKDFCYEIELMLEKIAHL